TVARRDLQAVEHFRSIFLQGRVVRLSEIEIVTETRELVTRLDRLAVCILDAPRYDQPVAGVLIEKFVLHTVHGVGGDIPDGLIDADDLASPIARRSRVLQ